MNMALAMALNHSTTDELTELRKENKKLKEELENYNNALSYIILINQKVFLSCFVIQQISEEDITEQESINTLNPMFKDKCVEFIEENRVGLARADESGRLIDFISSSNNISKLGGEIMKFCGIKCKKCMLYQMERKFNPFKKSSTLQHNTCFEVCFYTFTDDEVDNIYENWLDEFTEFSQDEEIEELNGITKEMFENDKEKCAIICETTHLKDEVIDMYLSEINEYENMKHGDCEYLKPSLCNGLTDDDIEFIDVIRYVDTILNPIREKHNLDALILI